MEILAPAGGWEQLIAAVRSGADAVYLGAGAFNARRNAQNFKAEDLGAAAAYCRGRGVRVYVTINTLLKDCEREELLGLMRLVAQSGADAVIIQDLGVMALFRERLPDMPRHASTQMTIHNAEGAKAARELGFSRAVLARELTLSEIRAIAEKTDIELECFVHGALCMSVSGQCGLSSMLGGRSGNRGLCAQPCRLDFRAGSRPYALSLKDMSYIGHLRELEAAGVVSLKIEGRMKRPEYVAAATDACVKALRGDKPDMARLERIFSRSGFTDGYLTGKRDLSMFGRRTEENAADSLEETAGVRELYRRELSRVPVDMELTIKPGERARLTVSDGKMAATAWGELPERTKGKELRAEDSLGRTGGTPFFLRSCKTDIQNGYTSKLNPLRREALEKLLELRSAAGPWSFIEGSEKPEQRKAEPQPEPQPELRLRFAKKEQLFEGGGEERYISQ
jgi:putative protease